MKNPKDGYFLERFKSIKFSLKGIWLLLKTESSIQVQFFFTVVVTIAGFVFDISMNEWLAQCLVIGLVLVAESLNTAIEKVADFIHPEYHEKIGFIKDISAGAAGFAAIISIIIAGIIYIPRIQAFF